MNGNNLFLDTNIILYLLAGDETLATFLDNKQLYISVITELELLSFADLTEKEETIIKDFIAQCKVIALNDHVKRETLRIRRTYKTKLPDSIIIATALYLDLPLITSDATFKKVKELTLIYYEKSE